MKLEDKLLRVRLDIRKIIFDNIDNPYIDKNTIRIMDEVESIAAIIVALATEKQVAIRKALEVSEYELKSTSKTYQCYNIKYRYTLDKKWCVKFKVNYSLKTHERELGTTNEVLWGLRNSLTEYEVPVNEDELIDKANELLKAL